MVSGVEDHPNCSLSSLNGGLLRRIRGVQTLGRMKWKLLAKRTCIGLRAKGLRDFVSLLRSPIR